MKRTISLLLLMFFVLLSLSACNQETPGEKLLREAETAYNEALVLIDQGEYAAAQEKLRSCIGYKDAEQILNRFVVQYAVKHCHRIHNINTDRESISDTSTEYTYDSYGQMTFQKTYSEDGVLVGIYEYRYDDQGRVTHQLLYLSDGTLQMTVLYAYDDYGNFTKKQQIDHFSELNSYYFGYSYEYDEHGWILSKSHYNEDGKVTKIEMWDYDEHGNKIVYYLCNGDGKVTSTERFAYKYDDNGRVVQMIQKDSLGSFVSWEEYEYDQNGNQTVIMSIDSTGRLYAKAVYEFDENGNRTLWARYDGSNKLKSKYVYEYDQYGHLILQEYYGSDGSLNDSTTNEYEEPTLYYNPLL